MDVPSTAAGKVVEVLVGKGSKVSKGTPLLLLEAAAAAAAAPAPASSAGSRGRSLGAAQRGTRRPPPRPPRRSRAADRAPRPPEPQASRSTQLLVLGAGPAATRPPFAPRISGSRSR